MDAHIRDLRYFVAVADELSFTKAAERLFVSQPALSKQVRQLESTLRVRLLDRDRRIVALTPAGAELLARARVLIAQWEETVRAVAVAADDTTLTVGFQTRIGRGLIPGVTAAMAARLPDWKLSFRQVSWRDATAGLVCREVDVAVAWLPVPAAGLSWRVVATEDRWVALPAGHPLGSLDVIPFARLEDEAFVALPSGPARDFWLATDQRTGPARVATEAATAEEAFEAVASGLGVTLLAAGNAEIYQREGVVCRPVSGLSPSRLAVVWRTGDDRPAIRVFVDSCAKCLCVTPPSTPAPVR
jgi:DNA-binding transcriptional LysR family regulator